ncbi:MAG: hypothetical protein JGK24_01030 [Microcoleus sp. PH2017_29_MFU_D_A]|uniref:hypothetical protein n=1 Tax=unclassified Microcoleus TaxID=2642155 RepID=UPI001D5A6AFC|nr:MULTISPECIES: hypothetical protein [unclassified Microcoleus]MCC3416657.1 hypothetical protein [Microcoleus sp. PH2017_07_MST_O_A]MCC3508362.1 hypothetical protein [Microcoleus sp. PH2017_17_BER_D_A]TAE55164.1 MAG: hypothetical protein EAZ88_07165 [Oscillatoriales cyanobacterium]MCC3452449.1 hypothetical protein [Microcoleus sp. PH2017_08_TRC_O_A]MCC3489442.1 hypothetical protein [Microcoleus sp. PH2017_16_JOR_D_A]
MKNKTAALSDISRTNQLKILENPQEVAEKLRKYLFKEGQGIEHFELKYPIAEDKDSENEDSRPTFYKERHKYIKAQVQERLAAHGEKREKSEIQYFLSYTGGKKYVFFLSPNKNHSGWQKLFTDNSSDRERIFNLIFKFYILSQGLYFETLNGFEELLLLHSRDLSKSKEALFVWGQNLLIKYNQHGVLTLTLSRKHRLFLPKDSYSTIDGDDLGDLLVYNDKNYYFDRDLDARKKNKINFMQFGSDPKNYDQFKKTQLYHYQNLMTKLEDFLSECQIKFKSLDFHADHYLENPFIKNIESVESLEIINNTGVDLTEDDRQFLQCFLKHQGISTIAFYNDGKTVSTYEQVPDGEDGVCWKITESIKWSDIQLEPKKNYLVFNKLLEEEAGSMAYQAKNDLWYPSTTIDNKSSVDFYSQLKKRFNYLETGLFFSTQGIDIPKFRAVGDDKTDFAVFNYTNWKIDRDSLHKETQSFTEGKILDVEGSIFCYLKEQADSKQWESFCDKYKIKISPKFQKVLIELGIKNWIAQSLANPNLGLPITHQSFPEKQFFSIYVRSPKNKEPKAVAVEFIYKDGCIYIKNVMRDMKQIETKFRLIRKKNQSEKLINDQKYFVDESEKLYISCYTDDRYTPTLIGRIGIIEDLESGELTIDRKNKGENSSRLLPLVSHYNSEIKPINRIQNMISLDLKNETFIQYYVPPAQNIGDSIKKGFKVYHLIGKRDSGESIPRSELIEHPIAALHFSTLTQNVLKIGDNSQSSLLQKVAQVLIEN